jgi:hypothetical protein
MEITIQMNDIAHREMLRDMYNEAIYNLSIAKTEDEKRAAKEALKRVENRLDREWPIPS